jgi:predicted nuclease of predicted toxin-antitoxin system
MKLWIDAQLSPAIASWIIANYPAITAVAVRDLGLRDATDLVIFQAARQATAVVMTKDRDFIELQKQFGAPPQIIWLTCGNTSNKRLQEILISQLANAIALLKSEIDLVEISGK